MSQDLSAAEEAPVAQEQAQLHEQSPAQEPSAPTHGGSVERRLWRRYRYGCIQEIAAQTGAAAPPPADFFAVRCYDLSRTGLSFLLGAEPKFESVVVALRMGHKLLHVVARVTHCSRVLVYPSGEVAPLGNRTAAEVKGALGAAAMVLVGARFEERLP